MRRVVVTGLGMVSPVGLTMSESWNSVLEGKSGIAKIEGIDVSHIPTKIAAQVKGFDPSTILDAKEARKTTRFVQFAIAASKEALTDSGLSFEGGNERAGASIGVGIGDIESVKDSSITLNEKGYKRISPFFIPYMIPNMAAGLVANTFGLKGPNICTTTACTSGTHGVGEAFMLIRNNMADVMVCGGAESTIADITLVAFSNMKALCDDHENPSEASCPFDASRSGFVMGEGAGILVLEEMESAIKRGAKIYCEVVGYGMSGDAHHITAPSPGGEGAYRCMKMAIDSAQASYEQVDYINAHGTSTKLNDLYETMAIKNLFKDHSKKLAVSSTKSMTGHCLGAAGGIEAVFTAMALHEQIAPPTINLNHPDPECDLDYVPHKARKMEIRYALSNSFGFGGTNGSLLFKRYQG